MAYTRYYRNIQITNNENSDVEGYQVAIKIDDPSFLLKADPNNLIFKDGSAILPYWVEYWRDYALIWTKVDMPANQTKEITLYYGGYIDWIEQDGDSVFEFFDDFNGDALDTNKWRVSLANGDYEIKNSRIYFYDSNDNDDWVKIYTQNIFEGRNVILESKMQAIYVPDSYMAGMYLLYRYPNLDISASVGRLDELHDLYSMFNWNNKKKISCNNYYTKLKIVISTDYKVYGYDNDKWNQIGSYSETVNDSTRCIELSLHARTGINEGFFDWVTLRAFIDNEPSIQIDTEQISLVWHNNPNKQSVLSGITCDKNGNPITGKNVNIYFLEKDTGEIIGKAISNDTDGSWNGVINTSSNTKVLSVFTLEGDYNGDTDIAGAEFDITQEGS